MFDLVGVVLDRSSPPQVLRVNATFVPLPAGVRGFMRRASALAMSKKAHEPRCRVDCAIDLNDASPVIADTERPL